MKKWRNNKKGGSCDLENTLYKQARLAKYITLTHSATLS